MEIDGWDEEDCALSLDDAEGEILRLDRKLSKCIALLIECRQVLGEGPLSMAVDEMIAGEIVSDDG